MTFTYSLFILYIFNFTICNEIIEIIYKTTNNTCSVLFYIRWKLKTSLRNYAFALLLVLLQNKKSHLLDVQALINFGGIFLFYFLK